MAKYRTPSSSAGTEEDFTRSIYRNGRFMNPWSTWKRPHVGDVLKWMVFEKNNSRIPSKRELDVTLPILTPDFKENAAPPESGVRVTWIGHATVLVQFDGITLITDPIFSQRCSPLPFAGPKRYRDVPCTVHDLHKLDAVVISHNHYDHLDHKTVQLFNARFGSELRWFVPRGLVSWMHHAGCENVIELDWWEENCIPEHPEIKFVFTPAQHWCKRSVADENKVLWGSWCVIGPRHRFFFAGDTGMCSVFEQIGNRYGPFDLAAIPIGAYEPRWFMQPQHVNPKEAVLLHKQIKAKRSIGIHWGTFPLTNEFYLEPPEKLKEALADKNLSQEEFFVLKHGEIKLVLADSPSHLD